MRTRLKHKAIADIFRDSDGSWDISLKPGYICLDTETHGIIENTLAEVRAKLRSVVPCQCSQCSNED